MVLGARGLSSAKELMLGSVSRQCLHHATSPIAIVHQPPSPGTGADQELPADADKAGTAAPTKPARLVVGIDGSRTARRALEWALDEARQRQSSVTIVHTWTPAYVGGVAVPQLYDTTMIERAAIELVDAAVADADESAIPNPLRRRVECGSAGPTIVAEADGADLIVIGSRGLGGFKGLLLGSVSHYVTHHATCPVVVIPHTE